MASIAEQLHALGVTGVLLEAAKQGKITELACQMPHCLCPEELGGTGYFERIPDALPDWMPTQDHIILKSQGGKLTVDNVRLAHRLCNRVDFAIKAKRPHDKDLERVKKAREEAVKRASVILRGERVLLRPVRPGDIDRLVEIRREPDVLRRWGEFEVDEFREEFVGKTDHFVIELDGEVVGAIQYSEELDPMYRHANIDIFLTTSRHGQGLGTEALRGLARYLFEERGHHRLTIDPAADNERAIRAFERVGFRRVGTMRQYERGPDGTWHDGLLMDMLRGDFRP